MNNRGDQLHRYRGRLRTANEPQGASNRLGEANSKVSPRSSEELRRDTNGCLRNARPRLWGTALNLHSSNRAAPLGPLLDEALEAAFEPIAAALISANDGSRGAERVVMGVGLDRSGCAVPGVVGHAGRADRECRLPTFLSSQASW